MLARIDPFRDDAEPCSYCPAQPAQRFTAADFGADLTDLVALELSMDGTSAGSSRILAQLGGTLIRSSIPPMPARAASTATDPSSAKHTSSRPRTATTA